MCVRACVRACGWVGKHACMQVIDPECISSWWQWHGSLLPPLSTMRLSGNWALCGISHEAAAGARGFPFSSPLFVSIAAVSMQEGDCVFTIHSSILLLFAKVLLTLIPTAALACLFLLLRRRAFSCTILQNSVFGNFSIPHSLSLIAPLPPPLFFSFASLSASRCLSRSALIGSCMM